MNVFVKAGFFTVLFAVALFAAASSFGFHNQARPIKTGIWRGQLINKSGLSIPFLFDIKSEAGHYILYVHNAAERLLVDDIHMVGDSVYVNMPFFDSEFRLHLSGDQLTGRWIRHFQGRQVSMPFMARAGGQERFAYAVPRAHIKPLYDIHFDGAENPSVGEFQEDAQGKVSGSILNVDGDYRYLEGRVSRDSLFLSTFDGTHAMLFKARVLGSGDLEGGLLFSGAGTVKAWTGKANPLAKLPDPYTQTSLKPGITTLDFSFKDLTGMLVSPHDPKYQGKVLIIQILGSWCPNCMDETAFLSRFYDRNREKVNVIGLAYERTGNPDSAKKLLQPFLRRFKVHYPILTTGFKPSEVLKSLGALNNFESFPTTLILDGKGIVRSIHTGFSGPGTGLYYDAFVEEFSRRVQEVANLHN